MTGLVRRRWAEELLYVWFHHLTPQDWFAVQPPVDEALRRRFAPDLRALSTRPPYEFLDNPPTALAAVLLFDQLPRNLYRGTPPAFRHDRLARAIAKEALRRGWDRQLAREQRAFIAMPLMHSEAIADQRQSLAFFVRLGDPLNWHYARSHHHAIARFGRFPHRNDVLGRKSTPAERRVVAAGLSW